MASNVPAFLVTKATSASSTSNIGKAKDMSLVLCCKCNQLRILISVVLMDGSCSYLIVTKCTVMGQFTDQGLIKQQTRDRFMTQMHLQVRSRHNRGDRLLSRVEGGANTSICDLSTGKNQQ